ncbi:hypothetical protein GDO86_002169 [Hymenochirus boettgeri]|uniref:Uncharacterized protein n=1 Tax=Hymenochirus boettgeri TaxID=247094 RepID=A0A8T2KFS8_9PIPI|nr:hypothetical protein GDO86_002169 [Hymenochirus boettgeri]
MAFTDLKAELQCSTCMNIYSDPVTLPCGHNFCQNCIVKTWDWQEGIDEYPSCPECRQRYRKRPDLVRNRRLSNIAELFISCFTKQHGTEISGESRCSVHHKILEYYCSEDGACVCVSCCLTGDHRGHRVKLLNEASKIKKQKLRNILDELTPEREEIDKRVWELQTNVREIQEKVVSEIERITAFFRDTREWLEALEKKSLSKISRQEKLVSLPLTNRIQQLETKRDELSKKICEIEELCNSVNPLTVLQKWESDGSTLSGSEEIDIGDKGEENAPVLRDLDVDWITETLLSGVAAFVTDLKGRLQWQKATDLLLDLNSAGYHISLSLDYKTASYSPKEQGHPQTLENFQDSPQVLSTKSFNSGQHYWEIEGSESGFWRVGVAYPSIERRGDQSGIGNNNKSWCLCRWDDSTYSVRHGSNFSRLSHTPSCSRIRISLDYDAGNLSFYELTNPIKHLHTFSATFTEPLYAAFWVGWKDKIWLLWDNPWVRILN